MFHSFCELIKKRFSHYEDFDNFPGQVYFMMILDTCNISATIDIEGADNYFTNLSLNYFPGEDISDLATTVLRHIKFMCGAYALPQKLGTTLLLKVCKTSSDISNQNILNYYSDSGEMETKYYPKYHGLM